MKQPRLNEISNNAKKAILSHHVSDTSHMNDLKETITKSKNQQDATKTQSRVETNWTSNQADADLSRGSRKIAKKIN